MYPPANLKKNKYQRNQGCHILEKVLEYLFLNQLCFLRYQNKVIDNNVVAKDTLNLALA